MKLSFSDRMQAAKDFYRLNQYALQEYVIKDGKKHPFALICPGGGYNVVCSFLEGAPIAKKLNEMGYSAFVVYYHVRGKAKYPAPQDDVARALTDILARAAELNLDTEGYSVWGSSAGGHLAASFGTESMGYAKYGLPRPGAIVLSYPVITMGELSHPSTCWNHIGKNPAEEDVRRCSVEQQVTENYPPAFVWYGEADALVDPKNSRMLAEELEKYHIPHRMVSYPEVEHGVGLGIGLPCEGWIEDAVAFWEEHRK